MAQAAKHLRKNKDLEAQLEQERKEKEEERVKKRSRSRDKKRKVLGLFTGGVVRGGVMWWWRGGRVGGEGGVAGEGGRKVESPPPSSFSVILSWSGLPGHTWKLSHMCAPTVCTHSLPGTHVCRVHTDAGKRCNTLHALLSTALYLLY